MRLESKLILLRENRFSLGVRESLSANIPPKADCVPFLSCVYILRNTEVGHMEEKKITLLQFSYIAVRLTWPL